jgi:hypothetical protein
MERALVITAQPAPVAPKCEEPTSGQRRALRALGVAETSVRHAAYGPDLFAYVEDDHSTLRLQIGPDGGVVGQTVLNRERCQVRGVR